MNGGYPRVVLSQTPTAGQIDVLAAFAATGWSGAEAVALGGIWRSTAKRHCDPTCEHARASGPSS